MIISVASGKGGTGKTTVATNLASALESHVQLLDCDVEQPNAHLFIQPEYHLTRTVTTPVPQIDREKCNFCGKCADICQFKAIAVIPNGVLLFEELCHGCGGCQYICPQKAITETGRPLGTLRKGRKNGLELVFGELRIGEAMAPPLIREVRRSGNPNGLTIVDAPPGTSCPVITAIRHTDFVLLVTEPTPFGLHDLKLAVEAVHYLNIPCGLVINRSDCGDDQVHTYAGEKGLPILLEIPFDRRIAEAYSNGIMFSENQPEWRNRFVRLFEQIKEIVQCAKSS